MTDHPGIPLLDLLSDAGLEVADIYGNPDHVLTGISVHAQRTGPREMFAAIAGTATDSHLLISEAVDAGASVILTEREIMPYPGVTIVRVPSTRMALGPLCLAFKGHPERRLKIFGTTGTNGKTTTVHLLAAILSEAGMNVGMIGTIGAEWNGNVEATNMTTPGPFELAEILARMVEAGVDAVVMEVSSHAIHQGRVRGVPFVAGGYTNISQDHLDYHGDFPTYISVKRGFFFDHLSRLPDSVSCFNIDDAVGEEMGETYGGRKLTYSARGNAQADVIATAVKSRPGGTEFTLKAPDGEVGIRSRLMGEFNLSNSLTAASMALGAGVDLQTIASGLAGGKPVAGRFEPISEGQPFSVFVDFAHTPDALQKIITTARGLCRHRLITVFGCGGDRDRKKRPIMGRIAVENSDITIITSDNPRSEDPADIATDIIRGISGGGLGMRRFHVQLDRKRAIEHALQSASPGDVVLIAGKGHEDYQEIRGVKSPFDDRLVAREFLREIAGNFDSPMKEILRERIT